MKKVILFLLAFIFLNACTTEEVNVKQASLSKIGDITKTPDLTIPENEDGWTGYGTRPDGTFGPINKSIGLRIPRYNSTNTPFLTQPSYAVLQNTLDPTKPFLDYSCYIANKAPIDYSGQNDFIVNMEEDGIILEENGDYNFPGLLSIVTFQNGLPIAETIKQTFWLAPNQQILEYNDVLGPTFQYPFMGLPAGTGDLYYNKAKVNPGKNLIVVEINPDLEINESNYSNNIATLPVNVTMGQAGYNWIGIGVLDLSAIDENQTHQATNLTAIKSLTGRSKYIELNWDCPYHEPIYVKHWFTVKKNGVIIADKLQHSDFRDTQNLNGNFPPITYEITVTVPGLGTSVPKLITVSRR